MRLGDTRNPLTAIEGVDLFLSGFNNGLGAASAGLGEHRRGQMYERALAAKAAADARYDELCRAWHILANRHERALDRIDYLESLLARR